MCCSKSDDVFIWIGAICVNIGFCIIISMSVANSWMDGFITSAIYTIVLFLLARYFDRPNKEQDEENRQSTTPKIIGLFYGLGALAVGVSGSLFALALVGNPCSDNNYYNNNYYEIDNYSACRSTLIRKQAVANIFLSAIPMIILSVALWFKKSIPTSGITMYIGIAVFGVALPFSVEREEYYEPSSFYKWWFLITSVLYILSLSYLLLSKNDFATSPITWGLNTGVLVFFWSMFAIVNIFDNDEIWKWIVLNLVSFLPLILLGLVTDQNFIIFHGASGFLLDAWRLASELSDNTIFQSLALAFTGLGVTALGIWLKKRQSSIRDPCVAWIESRSPSWMNNSNDVRHPTEYEAENPGGDKTHAEPDTKVESMCCSESSDVFSWIGAIIVNMSFLVIISTSIENSFILGFITCMVYTIVLFMLACYFERFNNAKHDYETLKDGSIHSSTTPVSTAPPTIVSLFYGLCVLSLGASGSILAISFSDFDVNDDYSSHLRKQAVGHIFLTAIPIIILSAALWFKKSIPTSGFTTYLGIAVFGVALSFALEPNQSSLYQWWCLITSTLYILSLSYLLLSKNSLAKEPITWGVNTGAFFFFGSMFAVVNIFNNDEFWKWIVLNLASFLPLILLGLVTDQNFIVFLGASGLLLDALRLAWNTGILIQFLTLAFAGLGVAVLGMWLKKHQNTIRAPCMAWIESHSLSPMRNSTDVRHPTENIAPKSAENEYDLMP